MPNRVFTGLCTPIRAFDAVIDGVSHQVQKGLAQPVDDPPITLRVAGYHLDFDLFSKRIGELACMSGQRFQKGRQGLYLEVEERVELGGLPKPAVERVRRPLAPRGPRAERRDLRGLQQPPPQPVVGRRGR
jgi:hypothetical protein